MWTYQKRLQYPVNIKKPDARLAKVIMSQFGGPDGELGASQRYLSQRYAMPYSEVAATLTDIGTEELAHMEIVSTIVRQLLKGLSADEIQNQGFADYYVDHTAGIWPQSAGGVPFASIEFQSKGDPITDLTEDLAADATTAKEQPAFRETRKPLILLGFWHFETFHKNGIPAIT
ncbi:MAG: manganese catalase family protein [Clostridia bacterium]|nr:manganese catalase family protein [Clostridia bacterium]